MLAAVQKSKMLLSGTTYAVVNGTLLSDYCSLSSNTVCGSSVARYTLVSNPASSLITLFFHFVFVCARECVCRDRFLSRYIDPWAVLLFGR